MRTLFDRIAVPLATSSTAGAWLRSWRLMAIDGVQIDVPDSDANMKEFGKAEGGTRRPFPPIHAVGLGECGTHAVVTAALGTIYDGEQKLAARLLSTVVPGMLLLADRGFFSFELWSQYLTTGADLLRRVSAGIKLPVLEILPDGSYLSVINSKKTRSASYRIPLSAVEDPRDATHIPVRVIEYTVTGESIAQAQTYRLITTILHPDVASALELASAYQQRWEYEISLKEIETQLLEPTKGLRSKTSELIRQEFWGLLLAHYAIRKLMTEAADTAELDPDRLSFLRTLNIVRRQVTNQAGFSPRHTEPGAI